MTADETRRGEPAAARSGFPWRRLLWLAICAAAGCAIGAVGMHFTQNPAWWFAVPAVIALGWLILADPSRCIAGNNAPDEGRPDR